MTLGNFAYGGIQRSYSWNNFAAGVFAPSITRRQGPPITCEMVFLKADPDNTSDIWIGGADVTSNVGFELAAGEVTGWIPISNLNLIYYVQDSASDRLQYMIVK